MKTIKITKADLDSENYYKEDGIGYSGPDEDASVEIEENLGWVRFKKGVYVTGSIVVKAGSSIKAGDGIEAGDGIKAGDGIEAGWGIKAGWGIEAGWGIKAGSSIKAGEGIVSLYSWIKAKLSIKIDTRCTIAAGIFSFEGVQNVEAAEIEGNVVYGNKKIIPASSYQELSK
jgi:hypothetical protein